MSSRRWYATKKADPKVDLFEQSDGALEPAVDHIVGQTPRVSAPNDLTTLHHSCGGDARYVEVLGQIAIFLGGWVRDLVFSQEFCDLFFGSRACDLGQADHLHLAFVLGPSFLHLWHFATAVWTPDFPENQQCWDVTCEVDLAFGGKPLFYRECCRRILSDDFEFTLNFAGASVSSRVAVLLLEFGQGFFSVPMIGLR